VPVFVKEVAQGGGQRVRRAGVGLGGVLEGVGVHGQHVQAGALARPHQLVHEGGVAGQEVRAVEEQADGGAGQVVAGPPGGERAFRHVRVVEAVARLLARRVVAVAGGEQVVAQEAQQVLVVVGAAKLQVGEGLVRDGHADGGQGRQLRVEGVRAG